MQRNNSPLDRPRRGRPNRTLESDVTLVRQRLAAARRSRLVLIGAASLVGGLVVGIGMKSAGAKLELSGPAGNAVIGPSALPKLLIRVHSTNTRSLASATLSLDGGDVTEQSRLDSGDLLLDGSTLTEGPHEVRLSVSQSPIPWPKRQTWRFTVDTTPPVVNVTAGTDGNSRGRPVRISGTVDEVSRVTVNNQPVAVEGGQFQFALPEPPITPPTVRARDRAGNVSAQPLKITVVPRKPRRPIRAVHETAIAWSSKAIRDSVFAQIDSGALTAVQLDLKDERGTVGYDSALPGPKRIGAVVPQYKLADAVKEIHARGALVVGRLVVFKDPAFADAAWANGHREQVVQTPQKTPYSAVGGFTNPASAVVRDYNLDIAEEAAKAGVDEVLFDYVRRPDGPIEGMRFPGIGTSSPTDEVIRFLAETQTRLKPYGTLVGASVFGIAASRPEQIAQDVGRMSRYLDVVAPMVYPSVWGPGEYQVADPERQPGDIVRRSLREFQVQMKGAGARPVPWLQAYDGSIPFGPDQIQAQIEAARTLGIDEFLLWNPDVRYQAAYRGIKAAGASPDPPPDPATNTTTDSATLP